MKNTFKNVGIIVVVAIIGLSMASCLTLGGGAYTGLAEAEAGEYYDAWPPNDFWAGFGLSGLQQPEGVQSVAAQAMTGGYVVNFDGGRQAYDGMASQLRRMGWEGGPFGIGASAFSNPDDEDSITVILSVSADGVVTMQLMK